MKNLSQIQHRIGQSCGRWNVVNNQIPFCKSMYFCAEQIPTLAQKLWLTRKRVTVLASKKLREENALRFKIEQNTLFNKSP